MLPNTAALQRHNNTIPNIRNKYSQKGIARSQSQFPHSCVYERFMYSHDRSAYSAAGKYVDQFPHSCVCERFMYSRDRSAYSAAGKYVDQFPHSCVCELFI